MNGPRTAGIGWRVVLLAAALVWGGVPAAGWAQTPAAASLAVRQLVFPFENTSRDPRGYWIAEGAAVLLTDDLQSLGAPVITRDERVRAFDRLRVPPVAALSHATAIRIGSLLGAERVILGSFDLRDDTITIRARVIRLDSGRMFPEVSETGPLTDIFTLFARVARTLVPLSRVTVEQMEAVHPVLPAFELFVKGVLATNPDAQAMYLTQALAVAPTFQEPRLALWTVYHEQGNHLQALTAVSLVPAEHPAARRARFLGAISLVDLSQYAQAFEVLTDLQAARPDAAVLNALGVTQFRRGGSTAGMRAAAYFAEASRLDPADPDLFFNLGYAYWTERNSSGAVAALREAVRRNPSDDEAHYVLGLVLQSAGSSVEAAREKELARRLSSTWAEWEQQAAGVTVPKGLERLGLTLDRAANTRVDEALVAVEQRDQREQAAFHLDAGRRLVQAERLEEAIRELRRAVFLAPYQHEAHLWLGRAYMRTGRFAEAVDALKIAIWSEDTIGAHLALADAYIQDRNPVAARAELAVVTTREPRNAEAQRLLQRLPPP